jgi:chorismate mutase/prephenate dehydrogenase
MSRTDEILRDLAARRPAGVVFDVCSLKSPIRTGLAALRDAGLRVASVHPMFGDDVELLAGQHVVFVDLGAGDALERARELFDPTMATQVILDAESHDRMMAYVLGLAHAVNIAFFTAAAGSGKPAPDLLRVSGTTFASQFDVARRVSRENAELYYEIQTLNDFGAESLDALHDALSALTRAIREHDPQAFTDMMREGLRYAGDRRSNLR